MTRETQTRRRFTWGINALGNRFAYSFVVAILINIAFHNEAFSLAVGLAVFLLLTAIVAVGRRH
jgi:FtsH-binding integral membrane protein